MPVVEFKAELFSPKIFYVHIIQLTMRDGRFKPLTCYYYTHIHIITLQY